MPPGLLAISCRRNGDINILWHHAGQRPQTSDCHLSLFHLVVAQGRPPICRTDWRGAAGRANLSCAMLWLCRFWGLISFRPAPLAERPKGCTLKRPPVGSIPSGRSQQYCAPRESQNASRPPCNDWLDSLSEHHKAFACVLRLVGACLSIAWRESAWERVCPGGCVTGCTLHHELGACVQMHAEGG